MLSQPAPLSPLTKVLKQSAPHTPKIIELGSGTGIAGLELAHLCPTSDIMLTDHPQAIDLLNSNLSKAKSASTSKGGKIVSSILDWDQPLPDEISRMHFNIVIVSDCTYNSDSIPALVKTLDALIERSPTAYIVVSMKRRHESEAVFFDLMADEAGFVELDCVEIVLPDRGREEIGLALEEVGVYLYGRDRRL